MATETKFTPGPWHVCGGGKCSCFTVMADHHPVAEITNGTWGDEWPEIRKDDGGNPEAFIAQSVYGEVPSEVARANWHLIAAAPDLYAALEKAIGKLAALVADPDNPDFSMACSAANPADAECLSSAFEAIGTALAKARGEQP